MSRASVGPCYSAQLVWDRFMVSDAYLPYRLPTHFGLLLSLVQEMWVNVQPFNSYRYFRQF